MSVANLDKRLSSNRNGNHQIKTKGYHQMQSGGYHQIKTGGYHQIKTERYHQMKPGGYHQMNSGNGRLSSTHLLLKVRSKSPSRATCPLQIAALGLSLGAVLPPKVASRSPSRNTCPENSDPDRCLGLSLGAALLPKNRSRPPDTPAPKTLIQITILKHLLPKVRSRSLPWDYFWELSCSRKSDPDHHLETPAPKKPIQIAALGISWGAALLTKVPSRSTS